VARPARHKKSPERKSPQHKRLIPNDLPGNPDLARDHSFVAEFVRSNRRGCFVEDGEQTPVHLKALALASGRVFGTQQRRGDNDLYPSGGNVVDKAGDEESPGEQRIGLQGGDINGHGLKGVGDGQGVEVCRGDAEVLREQLRGVGEAGDAAVVVMQDDEVPSRSDLTTAGFGDDAQHRHGLERRRGDSTADIADYDGLTGQEAEYIDGIDAGVDATDDHRLHRRHDLQICGEATAGEGLVAPGQGLNYRHWEGCFYLRVRWLWRITGHLKRMSTRDNHGIRKELCRARSWMIRSSG
jgi:hypothetical protein